MLAVLESFMRNGNIKINMHCCDIKLHFMLVLLIGSFMAVAQIDYRFILFCGTNFYFDFQFNSE
jgi:hypothetical protein